MQDTQHTPHVPTDPEVNALLLRPYIRAFALEPISGTYTAWIQEFPGCVTQGDTVAQALAHLEKAAHGWLAAALDLGQSIPEPLLDHEPNPWKAVLRAETDE